MITPEQRYELVRLRLDQAEQTYQVAAKLVAEKEFPTALNRIYYGMFYALLALGLQYEYETSKHQQLLGWFNKEFVNKGLISRELGKIVKKAFDQRMNADYEIAIMPKPDEMQILLKEMKIFIDSISGYLENQ